VNSFSELTRKEKNTELLRWISVLPAAVLGRLAAQIIIGVVMRLAVSGGWFTLGESQFFYYLQILVFYSPKEAAFVIAGAKMAPRNRLATTTVLAVSGILMSLIVHVLGQPNPGVVNYTHFAAEAAGAVSGAAYICFSGTKAQPSKSHREGGVEAADRKLAPR